MLPNVLGVRDIHIKNGKASKTQKLVRVTKRITKWGNTHILKGISSGDKKGAGNVAAINGERVAGNADRKAGNCRQCRNGEYGWKKGDWG